MNEKPNAAEKMLERIGPSKDREKIRTMKIEIERTERNKRIYWFVCSSAGTQCHNTVESVVEYLKTLLPFLEASENLPE